MMKKYVIILLIVVTTNVLSQHTTIPDSNFEQALIDLNLDNVLDGQVLTSSIDTLRYLDVSHKNINDLSGIQDFTHLETIVAPWNHLTNIDISSLNFLQYAYFENNDLIRVSVTDCPTLWVFSCHHNNISAINLQRNPQLDYLYAFNNNITNIDVSSSRYLYDLLIFNNNIEEIDLSNNVFLENLLIHNNNLSNIDLSNNNNLFQVVCAHNPNLQGTLDLSNMVFLQTVQIDNTKIEILNVKNGNNTVLSILTANNCNKLSCIFIDNPTNIPSNWQVPSTSTYVQSEAECMAGIELYQEEDLTIYPNPAHDLLNIFYNGVVDKLAIFSLSGQKIISKENTSNTININQLKQGVYIVEIHIGKQIIRKKLLVE